MRVLALSGRKQSGKSSLADYLVNNDLPLFGGEVKRFSFAAPIKTFLTDYLGVDGKYLYGSEEDKNRLSTFRVCDLPHWQESRDLDLERHVTYRELMQEVGTMLRIFDEDVFVKHVVREMRHWFETETPVYLNPAVAVIDDLRYPNELLGVRNLNNQSDEVWDVKIVRLTRGATGDGHSSETALNGYAMKDFDGILDNQSMTVAEQQESLVMLLDSWGWVEEGFGC